MDARRWYPSSNRNYEVIALQNCRCASFPPTFSKATKLKLGLHIRPAHVSFVVPCSCTGSQSPCRTSLGIDSFSSSHVTLRFFNTSTAWGSSSRSRWRFGPWVKDPSKESGTVEPGEPIGVVISARFADCVGEKSVLRTSRSTLRRLSGNGICVTTLFSGR
jgi:hypothetical protein